MYISENFLINNNLKLKINEIEKINGNKARIITNLSYTDFINKNFKEITFKEGFLKIISDKNYSIKKINFSNLSAISNELNLANKKLKKTNDNVSFIISSENKINIDEIKNINYKVKFIETKIYNAKVYSEFINKKILNGFEHIRYNPLYDFPSNNYLYFKDDYEIKLNFIKIEDLQLKELNLFSLDTSMDKKILAQFRNVKNDILLNELLLDSLNKVDNVFIGIEGQYKFSNNYINIHKNSKVNLKFIFDIPLYFKLPFKIEYKLPPIFIENNIDKNILTKQIQKVKLNGDIDNQLSFKPKIQLYLSKDNTFSNLYKSKNKFSSPINLDSNLSFLIEPDLFLNSEELYLGAKILFNEEDLIKITPNDFLKLKNLIIKIIINIGSSD